MLEAIQVFQFAVENKKNNLPKEKGADSSVAGAPDVLHSLIEANRSVYALPPFSRASARFLANLYTMYTDMGPKPA